MNTEIQENFATEVGVSVPSTTLCSFLIHRAYKYRIYPNAEQMVLLAKHFGSGRFIYNYFLEKKRNAYQTDKTTIGLFETHRLMSAMRKTEEFGWLKEVCSHALQASLRNLDAAFKRFYKAKREGQAVPILRDGKPTGRLMYEPRFKSKKDFAQSITFPDDVKVMDGKLVLPKFKLPIKMKMHRPLGGKICHATVSRSVTGKYYVSILCEEEMQMPPVARGEIGIDLGIKDMAVCSNGERIANPKFFEKGEKHLKYLQRQVSRKRKGSNGRRRAKMRLSRHHEKVANRRKDYIHKFTVRIVREKQTICIEDLNVKGMQSNHHLAKSIGSVSFNEIARQLEYKCRWNGRDFVKVGRWYASSKTCSHCGHKNNELNLKDREWICPNCGSEIDRDYNAALNILCEGKRILSGCGAQSDDKTKRRGGGGMSRVNEPQKPTGFKPWVAHKVVG